MSPHFTTASYELDRKGRGRSRQQYVNPFASDIRDQPEGPKK